MGDRDCVVCSSRVDAEGGYLEPNGGGFINLAFSDDESPIELWIHFHCLRRVGASEPAGDTALD